MRFGSICSGIEAASVASHPLGWQAAWLAEVDVPASKVLAHRYGATAPLFPLDPEEPDIAPRERKRRANAIKQATKFDAWGDLLPNYGDFTKLVDLVNCGEVEAPELLCGGTPCQAFSMAGRREGLADARGGLTLAFVELLDAIDAKREEHDEPPAICLWENVPGVLSSKDNAFGCFLAALAGEGEPLEPPGGKWTNAGVVLGPKRAIAWRVGNAEYFGVAQRRKRVIVVASARDGFDPAEVLFESDSVRRDTAPRRKTGEEVAGTLESRSTGGGFPGSDGACANHLVPEQRGVRRFPVICMGDGQANAAIQVDLGTTLTCSHDGPPIVVHGSTEVYNCQERGRDGGRNLEFLENVSYALTAPSGGGRTHEKIVVYDTTQVTSPANRSNPQPSDPYHTLAAGANPPLCVTGSRTHALTAEGSDASEDGTGRGTPIVLYESVVRRLMPVECERLQGFPDGWTEIGSDSQRYKQIGNSWAVPHIRWVMRRIDAEVARSAATPENAQPLDFDPKILWLLAA